MKKPHSAPRPLAELVCDLMTPVCRKRGMANSALLLSGDDLFGARFARGAEVERIVWPKGSRIDGEDSSGATLVVCADGATALSLQHLAPQIVERANLIIGWPAIARLRVTQARRRTRPATPATPHEPVSVAAIERHEAAFDDVADQKLKSALARLAAGVERRGLTASGKRP